MSNNDSYKTILLMRIASVIVIASRAKSAKVAEDDVDEEWKEKKKSSKLKS